MISDYENGGLRMLDLNSFNKALKLSWVRKYCRVEDISVVLHDVKLGLGPRGQKTSEV